MLLYWVEWFCTCLETYNACDKHMQGNDQVFLTWSSEDDKDDGAI